MPEDCETLEKMKYFRFFCSYIFLKVMEDVVYVKFFLVTDLRTDPKDDNE